MTKILIPTPLRPFTDKLDAVEVDGATIGELLKNLTTKYGGLKQHLYSADGKLRSFVNVYVNDDDIRYLQKDQTPLKSGDTVSIIPSVAGGAPSIDRLGALMVRIKSDAKGTKILIHCESGMGRAALIGAAYWISKGLTVGEAMARIAQAGVEPGWATEERKQLLRQWRSAHGTLVQGSPRRAHSPQG